MLTNGVKEGQTFQLNLQPKRLTSTPTTITWEVNNDDTLEVLAGAHAIAAGTAHTCAIVANDQSATCWGIPTHRRTIPRAHDNQLTFTAIAASGEHTCAIRTDKAIACWGNNQDRQAPIWHPGSYTHIAAGSFHNCAIKTDKSIACWGDNTFAQAPQSRNGSYTHIAAGKSILVQSRPINRLFAGGVIMEIRPVDN